MAEKPPLPLTYAPARPQRRVRLRPILGFLFRAGIFLFLGLGLLNEDQLISPHRRPSLAEWMLRLIPLWIVAVFGILFVLRTLRNESGNEADGKWNDSQTGRIQPVESAPGRERSSRSFFPAGGTLGIGASTFSGMEIGCGGAVAIVLFCVLSVAGMLAMVWWSVSGK